METKIKSWLYFSLFNILLVTLLGVVLRFKIAFEFPFLDQKNLLHAHSHFAFTGWITHTIYTLILLAIHPLLKLTSEKVYQRLIIANLICSYGMLLSFMFQGYAFLSLTFSTGSILVNYTFAFYLLKDLSKIEKENPVRKWFKAAIWFNVFSSIGTFSLAYLMSGKHFNQNWYLASVYYYLHFQYNGFFTFACFGIFFSKVNHLFLSYKYDRSVFQLFLFASVPTYFLSTLWANIPLPIYVLVVLAAVLQVAAWFRFLLSIRSSLLNQTKLFKRGKYLLLLITLSFTVKLLLQLGSTIPFVSTLAFGFRPIVIAYLHLILLAIISVFLIAVIYIFNLLPISKLNQTGLGLFVGGVYLNEILLGVQGVSSFSYSVVPFVNELLFCFALLMFSGLLLFSARQANGRDQPTP